MTDRTPLIPPEPINALWEEIRDMRGDIRRLEPLLDLLDTPETAEELGPGAIASLIVDIDTRQRRLETHLKELTDSVASMRTDMAAVRALLEAPVDCAAD